MREKITINNDKFEKVFSISQGTICTVHVEKSIRSGLYDIQNLEKPLSFPNIVIVHRLGNTYLFKHVHKQEKVIQL